jgi:UDP-glucose 4-epimerase
MSADRFAEYAGKRVLVTGGLGFIGSNLAHRLVALGADVSIIDGLIRGCGGNRDNIAGIASKVRLEVAELESPATERLVAGQEVIFNLAGQLSHVLSMREPQRDLKLNCAGQLALLEACRQHNPGARIVYSASRSQYGRPRYVPVDEGHPLEPVDVNGVHKIAAEAYHFVYAHAYGLPVCSLRLTNTYGPRQPIDDDRQGFVGWFIGRAVKGEPLRVFGDGQQKRDFTHVDDVIDALLLVGLRQEAVGQVFNLGGEVASVLELARLIAEAAGRAAPEVVPFPPERQAIEIGDFYADWKKINAVLGWEPRISLKEGLRQTLAFFAATRQA